ncbi:MAG: hypothetical protein AB2L14_01845 [Candidatus Xenobiia bacterium LiM19]
MTKTALFAALILLCVMISGVYSAQAGPLYDYTLVYYFFDG